MKKILYILSAVALFVAVIFGLGIKDSFSKGNPNEYIVNDRFTVHVLSDEEYFKVNFINDSDEIIENINVYLGIKGDKNYDPDDDEIFINLATLKTGEDDTYEVKWLKSAMKPNKTYTDEQSETRVGTNVEEIKLYNTIHKIEINGEEVSFNHGETKDLGILIKAGGALLLAIIIFAASFFVKSTPKAKKEKHEIEDNSLSNKVDDMDFSEFNNGEDYVETTTNVVENQEPHELTDEDRAYINSMEVVDLDDDKGDEQ